MDTIETQDPIERRELLETPIPGVAVVFSGDAPQACCLPLDERGELAIGRKRPGFATLPDERLSREHARIARTDDGWTLRDLQSRNGTLLDGVPVSRKVAFQAPAVIRVGRTILLAMDALPAALEGRADDGAAGPVFQGILARVARASQSSDTLLIHGESGAGKELVAGAFHRASPHAGGPFVAVNCAAIPAGLAERLLFGAKKGAFSGADADADGYLFSAHRGALFLDEIGELDLAVQAKLLRVFETGEVTPLGASTPKRISVRYAFATHRDLRAEVAAGRFRADLYYRIAGSRVAIPPLRERRADIPWLVQHALDRAAPGMRAHPQLIEACLGRAWPGNARELLNEIRAAAGRARATGATTLLAGDLEPAAGMALASHAPPPSSGPKEPPRAANGAATREAIEAALNASAHNVAAAAQSLGMNRTTLYRRIRELDLIVTRGANVHQ